MLTRLFICLFCCYLPAFSFAQSAMDKTMESFTLAVGKVSLGIAENDFLMVKRMSTKPEAKGGRDEVMEKVDKNGIRHFAYYFADEGNRPLYQITVEFTDTATCAAMAQTMLGQPNHPTLKNYWIANGSNNSIALSWTDKNRLIFASNLPGTEWFDSDLFKLPAGFELYKPLPGLSKWTELELSLFFKSLEKQLEVASADFSALLGERIAEGRFTCKSPLNGAQTCEVFQSDTQRRVMKNLMITDVSAEDALLWKLDAQNLLTKKGTHSFKLLRTKAGKIDGKSVDIWDVSERNGALKNVQLGIRHYEAEAGKGRWNVDILLIEK